MDARHALSVVPGQSVGPFHIGARLLSVLSYVRGLSSSFPSNTITFDPRRPYSRPIKVSIIPLNVALVFDPHTQRLTTISITAPHRLSLSFRSVTLSDPSANIAPTYQLLYQTFGATHPIITDGDTHTLTYKGLELVFISNNVITAELTDTTGLSPICQRITVTGAVGGDDVVSEPMDVRVGVGVDFPDRDERVRFGDSVQSAIGAVGPPDDVTVKRYDNAVRGYAYNYYDRGLDVVFDAHTHRAVKFVAHANAVERYDFGRYHKANVRVFAPPTMSAFTLSTPWSTVLARLNGLVSRPLVHSLSKRANPFDSALLYAAPRGLIVEVNKSGHIAKIQTINTET